MNPGLLVILSMILLFMTRSHCLSEVCNDNFQMNAIIDMHDLYLDLEDLALVLARKITHVTNEHERKQQDVLGRLTDHMRPNRNVDRLQDRTENRVSSYYVCTLQHGFERSF